MALYKVKIKDNQYLKIKMEVINYRGKETYRIPIATFVSENEADNFITYDLADYYARRNNGEVIEV